MNEVIGSAGESVKGGIQETLKAECIEVQTVPHISMDLIYRPVQLHRNTYGDVHGGLISVVSDTMMGYGAAAMLERYVTTTDLAVSFLSRMSGDEFLLHLDYNQIGKRMVRATCRFTDPKTGVVCATAQASFFILGRIERGFECDKLFEVEE